MAGLKAYVYYYFSPTGGNGYNSPSQVMDITVTGEWNGAKYHFSRTWNNNSFCKKFKKELKRLLYMSTPNMEYLKEGILLTPDECKFIMKEVY